MPLPSDNYILQEKPVPVGEFCDYCSEDSIFEPHYCGSCGEKMCESCHDDMDMCEKCDKRCCYKCLKNGVCIECRDFSSSSSDEDLGLASRTGPGLFSERVRLWNG